MVSGEEAWCERRRKQNRRCEEERRTEELVRVQTGFYLAKLRHLDRTIKTIVAAPFGNLWCSSQLLSPLSRSLRLTLRFYLSLLTQSSSQLTGTVRISVRGEMIRLHNSCQPLSTCASILRSLSRTLRSSAIDSEARLQSEKSPSIPSTLPAKRASQHFGPPRDASSSDIPISSAHLTHRLTFRRSSFARGSSSIDMREPHATRVAISGAIDRRDRKDQA